MDLCFLSVFSLLLFVVPLCFSLWFLFFTFPLTALIVLLLGISLLEFILVLEGSSCEPRFFHVGFMSCNFIIMCNFLFLSPSLSLFLYFCCSL